MASYVSFDPRAAANRARDNAEFSATLDSSSSLISDSARLVVLFARVHAVEIFVASVGGSALSAAAIYFGII